MRQFLRIWLRGALGLTAVIMMAASGQVQAAAPGTTPEPGAALLAQSAEPQKKKQAPDAGCAKEPEKPQQLQREKSATPELQMEKSRTKGLQEPPAAAGTKKIGGATIRGKEGPDDE